MMKNKKVLLLPLLFLFAVSPLLLSTASALTPREVDPYLRFEAYGWSDGYTVTIIGTMFATDPPLSWFDAAHAQLYDQDHVTIIYEADMPEYVTAYDFRSWRIDFDMWPDVNKSNYYPALPNGAYLGVVAFRWNGSEWGYTAQCLITVEKDPAVHISPQYNGSYLTIDTWLDVPQPYNTSNLLIQDGNDLSLVWSSAFTLYQSTDTPSGEGYSLRGDPLIAGTGNDAVGLITGVGLQDWSRYSHIGLWFKTNSSNAWGNWAFRIQDADGWNGFTILPTEIFDLTNEWTYMLFDIDARTTPPADMGRDCVYNFWLLYREVGVWAYFELDDLYLLNSYGFTESTVLVKDTTFDHVWYNETRLVPMNYPIALSNWTGGICPVDKIFNFNNTDLVLPNGSYYIQSYIDWCSDTYYASIPFMVGDDIYYGPGPEPGPSPPDLYMLGYQYLFWLFLGNGLVTYPFIFLALAGGLLVVTALKSNRRKYDRVILGFALVIIGLAMLFYASVLWGLNLASPLPLPYSILLNNWGTTGVLP